MIPLYEVYEALKYDHTLKLSKTDLPLLAGKYLKAKSYSRELLFDSMYHGKTVLFKDYPIVYPVPSNVNKVDYTLNLLKSSLPQKEKVYIRYGSNRSLRKVPISEVIERWARGRSKFGVTDLHFRGTDYFKKVDANAISYFNLLPSFPEEVSYLEMLTLVISSKGIFSDAHSDDGDGSNHCIVGKKLWFAWDRSEGAEAGLQDCTHDEVYDQANFSIRKFISLKSAHWFIVSEGKTLFMPGNFTHKVITLESYIGFGSFYVSFPNYVNSIKRWTFTKSGDVTSDFIRTLNKETAKYIERTVHKMTSAERKEIGFDYFLKACINWKKNLSKRQIEIFSRDFLHNIYLLNAAKSAASTL